MTSNAKKFIQCAAAVLIFFPVTATAVTNAQSSHWASTWGCGLQLTEPKNVPPPPGLTGNTLRQIVHASIGEKQLRVRFSNLFGTNAVVMDSVHVALSGGAKATSAIDPATDTELAFHGATSAVIPPGEEILSDPFNFDLPPLTNLAIAIYFGATSGNITGHPGSRTTSYILTGNAAVLNPVALTNLQSAYDSGDHLHLSPAGNAPCLMRLI